MTTDANAGPPYTIRRATAADVESLVELRLALLRSAGNLQNDQDAPSVAEALRRYFAAMLPTEAFIAWVAEAAGQVVAASGLVLEHFPPSAGNLSGIEAYVMNMYTVPAWRGQGIASALFTELLSYARAHDAGRVWLRATPDGRPIYARAGFRSSERYMEYHW